MNSGAYPPTVYTAVLNNGNWSYTVPANTLASGPYSVFAIATNGTEMVSSPQTTLTIIDNAPPVTTAATYTMLTTGADYYTLPLAQWQRLVHVNRFLQHSIFVLERVTDPGGSGIAATYYTLDGGRRSLTTYTQHVYRGLRQRDSHRQLLERGRRRQRRDDRRPCLINIQYAPDRHPECSGQHYLRHAHHSQRDMDRSCSAPSRSRSRSSTTTTSVDTSAPCSALSR